MDSTQDVMVSNEDTSVGMDAPTEQKTERVFRQEDVNEIVKRAKLDAVESFKRKSIQQQPEYSVQPHVGMVESDIRKLAAEEAQRLHESLLNESKSKYEQQQAQKIVQTFYDKVNAGKEKYADFDTVTGDLELKLFPNVVQMLAEHIDNSGDVLYELGKNRLKLAQLEQLSYMSPRDAIKEAQRLASSIRENEKAASIKQPNAPLSQQRPSNIGTESGVLTVDDYRKKYRG